MEMEHARGFNEHEQLSGVFDVGFKLDEQVAPTGGVDRQISFEKQLLVGVAQSDPYFMFGGIEAEEVGLFH